MSEVITAENREAVFNIVDWLDRHMSDGNFAAVDKFLGEMDMEKIFNPGYLLACANYVHIAKEQGDVLHNGPDFRTRALARMRLLIGDERAELLFKNR